MREETLFQKTRSNLFTLFLARKIGTALRLGSSFDEPQSYAFLMVIPAIQSWRRRRSAVRSEWAGAGTFNVVAPGFINTAALSYILSDPERNRAMGAMVPMRGAYPGAAGTDGVAARLVCQP